VILSVSLGQTVARTSPRTRRASPRIRDVRAVHKDVPEAVPVPAAELREPPAAPVEDVRTLSSVLLFNILLINMVTVLVIIKLTKISIFKNVIHSLEPGETPR